MSRRSRRSKSSRSSTQGKSSRRANVSTWLIRVALFLIVVAAVLSVGGYLWLRNYLAGSSFRQLIVQQSSQALHADVQLSPLRWDGFRVNADTVEASGKYHLQSLSIDGVRTGIDAGRVTSGVWSVVPSRIGHVSAIIDTTAEAPPIQQNPAPTSEPTPKKWYDSFIPQKLETGNLVIDNSDIRVILSSGTMRVHDIRWELEPMKNIHQANMKADGGKVTLPFSWAPHLRLHNAMATYQDSRIYLTQSQAAVYERGQITLAGEWDNHDKKLALQGELDDVQCSEVLSPDWKQKLTGVVGSHFTLDSKDGVIEVKGSMQIRDGTLTALPVLDKLAAYSQSLRFRTLSLHDASCDYTWRDGSITLTKIKLGSDGLASMEGACTLRPLPDGDYALDGDFQVGLAPGTLATIPGAEEDVFTPGPRGLLWAPMRLTGTMNNPKEDLSDRLMAAAGARMFDIIPETGAKVLKYTKQIIEEGTKPVVDKVVEQGTNLVEQGVEKIQDTGTKAVEGVTEGVGKAVDGAIEGIFRGVLDGGTPEKAPPLQNNNSQLPK